MDAFGVAAEAMAVAPAIQSTRPGFNALMLAHASAQLAAAAQQSTDQLSESTPRTLIAPEFDAAYYLANNDDVRLSVMDPLEHFLWHGAAELRNPNAWFDTGFYVRSNADVVDADVNPFWHYLAHGKAEGRKPGPQRHVERATLARAVPANRRWIGALPADALRIASEVLRAELLTHLQGSAGFTVSVSHDRYTESIGGVQILVADEQAAFNRQNETYLHIAPAVARMMLAPSDDAPFLLHLTIDGVYLGLTSYSDLGRALADLASEMPMVRRLVVHCLLGHQVDPLITLHAALCL
jgi:hypothetical protein